jgi:hypothetical protein
MKIQMTRGREIGLNRLDLTSLVRFLLTAFTFTDLASMRHAFPVNYSSKDAYPNTDFMAFSCTSGYR